MNLLSRIPLPLPVKRFYVLNLGRSFARDYYRAVEAIGGDVTRPAMALAEQVAPCLMRYRRRAKACARLLRRLSR